LNNFFLTNQARELPIYIKKKISSKWTHTDTTTTNNYAKKTNSTKGKKTTTVVGRIGTSTQTAHNQSSTQKKEEKNHHQRQITTLHRQPSDTKDVRAKTPLSPLAPSLPTMIHTELACCQAGLAVIGRYELYSPPIIRSACTACQDDVLFQTSHRKAGLATIVRCKLPNQRVSSCL
jgi:hypothetical protein